jgi:hypothetical protein
MTWITQPIGYVLDFGEILDRDPLAKFFKKKERKKEEKSVGNMKKKEKKKA